MLNQRRIISLFSLIFMSLCLLLSGCATNLSKPAHAPAPAKTRLGEYKAVEMKAVTLSDAFASASANQKATRKIDELLFSNVSMVFPNLKRIEAEQEFSNSDSQTLQITPLIKEIKFVGGAARFWAGAMAGSSAVLMQVTLRDSSTGEIIADPEFYRAANAYAGGWTIGATDNQMLEDITKDIAGYCSLNR